MLALSVGHARSGSTAAGGVRPWQHSAAGFSTKRQSHGCCWQVHALRAGDRLKRPMQLFDTERFRQQCREGKATMPPTVYTVRIQTSRDRGSGLDQYDSGMQLGLMGRKGDMLLHRIGPIEENSSTQDTMAEICELVGEDGGAVCNRLPSGKLVSKSNGWVKRRFQSASIDEVSFVGPDLGPLSAVVVGPEVGTWKLDEMIVSNSRENVTQRFVCREGIGAKGQQGAAFMTPLPPGAVVYGSGEQAVLMTQDQADSMQLLGMEEYSQLKHRIFVTTTALLLLGIGISAAAGGTEAAEAYLLGGSIAFVFQMFVNRSVDGMQLSGTLNGERCRSPDVLGKQVLGSSKNDGWMRDALGDGMFRAAVTISALLAAVVEIELWHNMDAQDEEVHKLSVIVTAMLGFATYKVAMVAATLTPAPAIELDAQSIKKL